MPLNEYKAKRKFDQTTEPKAKSGKSSDKLHFYVQKHAARRLHYDFRLELDGVLLSWAIPKGPSMNPTDKRLAMHVEDHPLEYGTFEGTIPEGNYGAGTVMLWDKGTYFAPNASTKKESEKLLREGLAKGHLQFELDGIKLKGKFDLFQLKNNPNENAWLLVKSKDKFANEEDILQHDYSVKKKSSQKKEPNAGEKAKKPKWIRPMLAKLVDKPFDDKNWLFEIKWDGYRVLSYLDKSKVNIYSRNENSFNTFYPEVVKALQELSIDAILDGEVVSLDKTGRSTFDLLKTYQRDHKGYLCYYVFDLLYYNGRDLRSLPLIERKELLKEVLKSANSPILRYGDHVEEKGVELFKIASKKHLEGVIGKLKTSSYQSRRSSDWVKIKTSLRQEVVIGGYTQPKGSRKKFGALLLGVFDKEGLRYIGHVGGGFDHKTLEEVYSGMQPLIQKKCPFTSVPKGNNIVTWVKPKLICEISFAEWTADQKVRMPIFHGLRIDKKASSVVKEEPLAPPKKTKKLEVRTTLTNLDKLYWKKEKITKGDVIEYYRSIGPYILPYLKNRPIMLHRFPEGIDGENFYQKNLQSVPPGIETTEVHHTNKTDHYLLINNLSSLLYAVNLGSFELHPMIAHIGSLDYPDFTVLDLDPEDLPFKKVVECANTIHELLEELKIPHYCKTSGGRGLHIYIPLKAKYKFEQTNYFAELLAHMIQQKMPSLISLERLPAKRQKRIYIDYLQNTHDHTMVAPYSIRPRPHAPVSTPLKWNEVNDKLDPLDFNIKTVPSRLIKLGDLFKPTLSKSINLSAILKRIEHIIH